MTTVHGPSGSRRRLRTVLRQARESAGLTQEEVAEATEWSSSKVIRIESGTVNISVSDLKALLRLYRITEPADVGELVELARVGRRRAWWTAYKDSVPPAYLAYIGLEAEASALRYCQPISFPAMLQTPGYASADLRGAPALPAELVEQRLAIRMIRQREVLDRASPPEISAVLDEAVLHQFVGNPHTLREQLLHLVELGSRPNLTIRVFPFGAEVARALSPFHILEFPDPADSDVVYMESALGHTVVDRARHEVKRYRLVFEAVEAASLPEEDSLALIAHVAGELG